MHRDAGGAAITQPWDATAPMLRSALDASAQPA